jgi:uncharacterized protein (DUF433 family)
MATAPKTAYAHITKVPRVCGGSACIDNTRIRVMDVVLAKNDGQSPEQIRDLFAVKLTLAQVYSALAYADENREEIEADFGDHEAVGIEGEGARDEYLKRH